jgi:1-aminocyclopropane-1-carboxylate deaminase/D-cysteine desulfhydrase-like pyridoxal-dependent ACC family enzyme
MTLLYQSELELKKVDIVRLHLPLVQHAGVAIDVLRLDELHPVISGNKYFKLKYYLQAALRQKKHTLVSFGGAYSNHLVAMAYAARQLQLQSVGIIRGERPAHLSHTLQLAAELGMRFQFVSRTEYREKKN